MDNYNKEKVITTNKISLTTGINETAKMALLNFSFISVSEKIFINNMNIYIYIYKMNIYRTENLNCRRLTLKLTF